MNDDVGPPLEWPQQDRRCHGVVDDERHAVAVRDRRERLDVTDIAGGIANALAEHRPGVVIDQGLEVVGSVGVGEPHLDTLARQDMSKQRMRGAVELGYGDEVSAHLGDVGDRIVDRRLPGRDAQGREPALERCNAALEHRIGRIVDPRVPEPIDLQIEQRGPMLRAVEGVSRRLIDRHRDRLGGRLDLVAAMDRLGLAPHASPRGGSRTTADALARPHRLGASGLTIFRAYRRSVGLTTQTERAEPVTLICQPRHRGARFLSYAAYCTRPERCAPIGSAHATFIP